MTGVWNMLFVVLKCIRNYIMKKKSNQCSWMRWDKDPLFTIVIRLPVELWFSNCYNSMSCEARIFHHSAARTVWEVYGISFERNTQFHFMNTVSLIFAASASLSANHKLPLARSFSLSLALTRTPFAAFPVFFRYMYISDSWRFNVHIIIRA